MLLLQIVPMYPIEREGPLDRATALLQSKPCIVFSPSAVKTFSPMVEISGDCRSMGPDLVFAMRTGESSTTVVWKHQTMTARWLLAEKISPPVRFQEVPAWVVPCRFSRSSRGHLEVIRLPQLLAPPAWQVGGLYGGHGGLGPSLEAPPHDRNPQQLRAGGLVSFPVSPPSSSHLLGSTFRTLPTPRSTFPICSSLAS